MRMAKIRIEVCLISARGLQPSSSFWKLQWFAVGWINANNKYCTKIDTSGNPNPTWNTKFVATIDSSTSSLQGMALHVEVYSREPIFLREKIQGSSTIPLKEFFTKYNNNTKDSSTGMPEIGSFQLRKKNSSKPRGFIDISIQIFEEKDGFDSFSGYGEGFMLYNENNDIPIHIEDGSLSYPPNIPTLSSGLIGSGNHAHSKTQTSHTGSVSLPSRHARNPLSTGHPIPSSTYHSDASFGGTSYRPPKGPPPQPLNTEHVPTLLPGRDHLPENYVGFPSSKVPHGRDRPMNEGSNFVTGVGTGALAAGAMIFGDDFLHGMNLPSAYQGRPTFSVSTDSPPF